MTSLNTQLWELISTHEMPNDASGRPFIENLMKEHRISRATAAVAIAEYRKFIYLCATRSGRNVPSKAVDLVWHLHMQHSRDYWDVFCKKIGKPIHHAPGGQGAGQLEMYKATVEAYKRLWGTPPKGIWRQADRFKSVATLVLVAIFLWLGARAAGDNGDLFGLLWLCIPIFIFGTTCQSLTNKGQFTLIFECRDPFADRDAGDCGSADCGGCGD